MCCTLSSSTFLSTVSIVQSFYLVSSQPCLCISISSKTHWACQRNGNPAFQMPSPSSCHSSPSRTASQIDFMEDTCSRPHVTSTAQVQAYDAHTHLYECHMPCVLPPTTCVLPPITCVLPPTTCVLPLTTCVQFAYVSGHFDVNDKECTCG